MTATINIMSDTQQKMLAAQQQAKALFNTVEERGLIVPGKSEKQLSDELVQLAKDEFGTDLFWHKKIVRAGINTLEPYSGNPPDRIIEKDDIVILDFGPVFNGHEADLGRTYVLGNDLLKLKMKDDVESAWREARNWYFQQTELSGAQYFNYLSALAKEYGWEYGGELGGHIVGPFPHEQPDDPADLCLDIHPDNHASILSLDKDGNSRHWILEIHFVDRENGIGGFFEQLIL